MKIISLVLFLLPAIALSQYGANYEDARATFRSEAKVIQATYPNAELLPLPLPVFAGGSVTPQDLTTDVLYIPAQKDSQRLIIVNSGIHGIEGYVGSAVQIDFLRSKEWQKYIDTTGFIFIHAMNPFGFKNFRRANENNVDLNRNFLYPPLDFSVITNIGYRELDPLLNPHEPANFSSLDRTWFYIRAVKDIVQYTMKSLRQAVLQGQYEFDKGVYFGGKDHQHAKRMFDEVLARFSLGYQAVFLIDLHTGYGKRGQLHLMSDLKEAADQQALEKVFPGTPVDYGSSKDFYEIHGGLVEYFYHTFQAIPKRVGIVLEFGTLNSQTTLGSLDSVYRMSRENQGFQFGYLNEKSKKENQEQFREMFYPSDMGWRKKALDDGRARLNDVLKNF